MANEFFMRFNIHKSWGDYFGSSPYVCRDIIGADKEEIEAFLKKCDDFQTETADELKEKYKNDMGVIKNKRVLFLGDSLTSDRKGYRGCVTKCANLKMTDASISGATSSDMLCVVRDYIPRGFDIISLMIGTNDAVIVGGENGVNRTSVTEYRRNMEKIIDICKECCDKIIIHTIPLAEEQRYNIDGSNKRCSNENINLYNEIVRDVAKEKCVYLNDVGKHFSKMSACDVLENDGIHLNEKGHKILADKWIDTAIKMF